MPKKPKQFTIERAIQIAARAHAGQKDKAGSPYILHALRVMLRMKTPIEMIVAVLHDVVEDTSFTLGKLKNLGLPRRALRCLDLLTHKKSVSYEVYLQGIARDPLATKVKLADLRDNMDLSRIKRITRRDINRLRKYKRAVKFLSKKSG